MDKSHAPGDSHPIVLDEIALYTWSDSYPEAPLFEKIHTKSLLTDELLECRKLYEKHLQVPNQAEENSKLP